jgi:hypothetical protein
MSTWGGKLRLRGYSTPPQQLATLEPEEIVYDSFAQGIVLADSPDDVKPGCAVYAIDMEVTRADRLIRGPGVTLLEDATPRSLLYTFEQASLDYTTELVTIDPPWLGYKGPLAYTWVNLGIGATGNFGWTARNIAGTLLFSNGFDKTYTRAPLAAVVTDRSAQVVARTFALAFGRTFAGGYMTSPGLGFQALGLRWASSTDPIADWTGTNSGFELLLADQSDADRIVALHTIGWDVLGILCRKSLWVGVPTGVARRPADFRTRFQGSGCASRDTVESTPQGVTFLSDEGVASFNVNQFEIISGAINAELLPIDYLQLSRYKSAYQAVGQRYILCTPSCTWVYEFPIPAVGRPGRWFKRSGIFDGAVTWAEQSGVVSWDQVVGSWDSQTLTWDQMVQNQSDVPSRLYLISGTKLGREDYASFTNFGTPLTPVWRTPQQARRRTTGQITTTGFEIVYSSTSESQIHLRVASYDGLFTKTLTKTLPSTGGAVVRKMLWANLTGMGLQAQIEIASGSPEIARLMQIVQSSGPVIGSLS